MNIIESYMEFLYLCESDVYTLFYFWSDRKLKDWNISRIEYGKEWCQDALDFAYRMVKTGLMDIDYSDNGPTSEEMKKIFQDLSVSSPDIAEGGAIWSAYQFFLTKKGEDFVREWKHSEDNELFERKLTEMLDDHDVGFDKRSFVPVNFQ
ncbi:hypothetical protein [Komagataeibacter oboediens]|uniref:hypothetical protein n=1 Tax=Komagataeibacter oboediens TaxID=65958 RepID=UPI001908E464|nr:hypothetical protein [Komagataeibacter oboediens]